MELVSWDQPPSTGCCPSVCDSQWMVLVTQTASPWGMLVRRSVEHTKEVTASKSGVHRRGCLLVFFHSGRLLLLFAECVVPIFSAHFLTHNGFELCLHLHTVFCFHCGRPLACHISYRKCRGNEFIAMRPSSRHGNCLTTLH